MLRITVCVKQVVDPESPASAYAVDSDFQHVVIRGAPPVISPFDESALEAALRIKDVVPSLITVLSAGFKLSLPLLRKTLAAGADNLLIIDDEALKDADSGIIVASLAKTIPKSGPIDLVFTGVQAADTKCGAVGAGIAVALDMPFISNCRSVELENNVITAKRMITDGYQVIQSTFPSLFTIGHELGELRAVSLNAIMSVQKKPVTVWTLNDLDLDAAKEKRARLLKTFIPVYETKCEFLSGSDPEESGRKLALKLREAKII